MSNLAVYRVPCSTNAAIALPEPRVSVAIRTARLSGGADLQFIDRLQRTHARMVGWFPTKRLESAISLGHVVIAEEHGIPVGYCMSNDRYFKRDDCGIVYQLNVTAGKQRGLVGAALIKAVFDRAAYGCKLFCCWCAQDLEANHFWESLGFVPLAFRTGSRKAGRKKEPRIHIFWQRRIREGDSQTPYWFPSETTGGAIRENRIALPIPPGTHWSDAKPAVLPEWGAGMDEALKALPVAEVKKKPRVKKAKPAVGGRPPSRGVWVAPPPPTKQQIAAAKKAEQANKPRRERFKNDPKLVAAARELRDRYIEQINAGLLLPPSACGKYDVSRQLEGAASAMKVAPALRLLNAA